MLSTPPSFRRRAWLLPLLALLLGSPARAQTTPPAAGTKAPAPGTAAPPATPKGKLSSDPAQFILDVQTMMATTNNAAAKAAGASLQQLWGSNRLTASQQASIVALSQQMLTKKYRPRPHLEEMYAAIVGGATTAKLTDQQMDELLATLTKTVELEAVADAEKYFAATSRLLNGGYLYRSGYNTLRTIGGTLSFAYNEGDAGSLPPAPAPEPVVPKPATPKPTAPAPTATTTPKPKPKPKPAPKKKSSSGWDSADMWSSGSSGGGWGDSDSGWGSSSSSSTKKKTSSSNSGWGDSGGWDTPKKTPAKSTAKSTAKPAASKEPVGNAADFADPPPFDSNAPTEYVSPYLAPSVRGPVFVLKDADLFIATAGDSIFLRKVTGTVVPEQNRFVATQAQLTWSIKTNLVTADMTGFDFDLTKPEFTAEPVTLTYPYLLEAPVKGALSYKSVRRKPGAADTGYPRFISLTNDARIKTLGANISYQGGLSMAGSRLLSAALDGSEARLLVSLDGKPKFRATSRAYVLGDSLITADRAGITLYESPKDSITHPGVTLKYLKGAQVLKLGREEGLFKNSPYKDSYHQMEMRSEMLTWPLQKPTIDFSMLTAKNQVTADFESSDYFAPVRYQQIKAINRVHPLQLAVNYSNKLKVKKFNVLELADASQLPPATARTAMAGLARDGFIQWNSKTGEVVMLPKAFHYVAASKDKADYDHIAIKSLSGSGRNATLNLTNNELLIRGVERFNFSHDTATVYVQPDSGVVRVQKNRNMKFSGRVVASNLSFKGKEFLFDYDGFYVDMPKIDSILMRSKAKKPAANVQETKRPTFALTNKGGTTSGRLFLNDPKNKSGRKIKGSYPAFNSNSPTSIAFNNPNMLGGAYDSTMHFDIPPFKLDSLDKAGGSKAGFTGVFNSGGILPPIKTKLVMQDDGSLGFVHDAPAGGYDLYGGKGKLTGKVRLDNKGLQATGAVKYLGGNFTSDQFVFYKDSVVTQGKTGTIAAGANTPKVTLPSGYLMRWAARSDSMYLTTPRSGAPVKLYADAYSFKGTALLTPKGLGGDGRLDGPQSFIKSPEFNFRNDGYAGKKATLSVKSGEAGKPALTANDVAFEYNMQKGYADFTREEGSKASIELPYSQFKTTLSGGRWDFKKKQVQLRVAAGADSSRTYFYSTKPEQNGLRFKVAQASYNLANYSLEAKGVPHIASADAWIVPDSGKVSILANAKIKPFKNAGVILDSLAKNHELYKGNISVLSRNAFSGDALYSFKNASSEAYDLKFSGFQADSAALSAKKKKKPVADEEGAPGLATTATAVVQPTEKFQLAPGIGYRGNITLNSQRRGLVFDGQVRLQFGRGKSAGEWFAVQDSIDPKNVSLTLRNPKAEDGAPLVTGIFMSDNSNKVYPLYVSTMPNTTDFPIFTVDGQLRYDNKRREYTLARHDLTDPNIYQGAALVYHDSTATLNFRGKMDFIRSNKDFGMVGSGVGRANPDSARYEVGALLGFDINMSSKAVDLMAAQMAEATKNSPEALDGSSDELYRLGEFAGSKAMEGYANRKGGAAPALASLTPKLQHTIVLSRVDLRWSEKKRAWYSVGKLGLAGIGKRSMNALIDGYVEIKHDNGIDNVELYLEAEPQTWYYLKFANNILLAKGQNEGFDAEIGAKAKGDANTATSYGVFLGEFGDVDGFRSRFQREYLGGTGKLSARPAAPASTGNFDFGGVKKGGKKKAKDDGFGSDSADGADAGSGDAPTAPEPTSKKKKKKGDDPFGDGTIDDPNATPPPAEPASKKKKGKEDPNDPFSNGGDTPPAPKKADTPPAGSETPKEEAPQKEKVKTKTKEGDAPAADNPATGDIPTAPEEDNKKKKKAKEPAANEAPAGDAPVGETPPADEGKKKKKEKEPAATETPATTPPAGDTPPADDSGKKKKKEKEKKADPDDPFGGS